MLLFIIPFTNVKHSQRIRKNFVLYCYLECRIFCEIFANLQRLKKKGLSFPINDNIVSFCPFLSEHSKAKFFVSLPVCFVYVFFFLILGELFKLNFFFLCIQDPLFSECWLELEQSGILRMALVDHIFSEFIQKGLSKQDILDMMEVYGLITKFSCSSAESGQEQTEFFVPSQLRSSPSGLCELKPSESDPCPLYLHFLDGFVPNGFFPQLLSNCIHWCSKQRLKGPPQLFQNGARLLIGVHDIFELILLCRKRFIKVLLKKKTSSNSSAGTCATRLMANKVRDSLEETLQSLSRELSWLCNLRYELCVLCGSCSEQCRKHGLVSCDHDDCQHLLQVTPGEELFCLRSFCDNTVKVHGLEKWFHLTEVIDYPFLLIQ